MKGKMTFKEWFLELMRDERGAVSIKPVVAIFGTIILCASLMISAFSKKAIEFSDALVNSIMVITCIGLGADTFDKFSYKKGQSNFGGGQDSSDKDIVESNQKPTIKSDEPDLENLPRN